MAEPIFTVGASSYYLEFDGLQDLPIKSIAQVSYEGKGTGSQKAIASTRGGKTFRQTTIGGYETHPTMTIEVYLSGEPTSASFQLYACNPKSSVGGQRKLLVIEILLLWSFISRTVLRERDGICVMLFPLNTQLLSYKVKVPIYLKKQ